MWNTQCDNCVLPSLFGKRTSGSTVDRRSALKRKAILKADNKVSLASEHSRLLDFILDSAEGDERPYLEVTIFGIKLLGLLDSGASRTIVGRRAWTLLQPFCRLDVSRASTCKVANGQECASIGTVCVPISLQGRIRTIEVLVIPALTHSLILGTDFWREMDIVPNLRTGCWKFATFVEEETHIGALCPSEHLTEEQRVELRDIIGSSFQETGARIGCTSVIQHRIQVASEPIKQRYYPLSPKLQELVNKELDEMLRNGIVEPSSSPWASPVVMVRKRDNTYRFCIDFRRLNGVTQRDAYPLPYMNSILDKLRDSKYLTTIDIRSAYWQIPLEESSKQYTAFIVPGRGLFQFRRMPFGLHNAPATFQRLIDQVIGHDLEPFVFPYLDDIILVTPTFEEHLRILRVVLERLQQAGLTLNKEKCNFCKPELRYLGYIVNEHGLSVDPEKVSAILSIPTPTTAKEVRRILGMASWYRRFIPDFASVTAPLGNLLKKNRTFDWDEACETAFDAIKGFLVSAPVLSCPDFNIPFSIQTDASGYGISGVLTQIHPEGEKVVSYASRSLSRLERAYSTTERECLAVRFAINKFRPYIEATRFTVITDHHSLKWLQKIQHPPGRLARWAMDMAAYEFDIIHRKGAEHVVPDTLSRSVPVIEAIENQQPIDKWYTRTREKVEKYPLEFPKWRVEEGKLYKHAPSYRSVDLPDDPWKLVVPKEQREELLKLYHDADTAGHLGIRKTCHRVVQKYYWPKMRVDIAKYVRRCAICEQTKPEQKAQAGLMGGHSLVTQPWQDICMDIIGPLPRSTKGNSYILVVADLYSKFALTYPMRQANAKKIVTLVEEGVFLMFGVPRRIICDNGVQFRSREFRQMIDRYGIRVSYTAYYHPQANPCERVNRVIKTMLMAYVKKDQKLWDTHLQQVTCAYRTAFHEVIGFTPYFVNFGREMELHPNREVPVGDQLEFDRNQDATNHRAGYEVITKDIQGRLQQAYERSRRQYNLRKRPDMLTVGQLVWRRNHVLSDATKGFSAKLAPRFVGPFVVEQKLSPWVYRLRTPEGEICPGSWHMKDLKPSHQLDP